MRQNEGLLQVYINFFPGYFKGVIDLECKASIYWGRDKMAAICRWRFQINLLQKASHLDHNFTAICSQDSSWRKPKVGTDMTSHPPHYFGTKVHHGWNFDAMVSETHNDTHDTSVETHVWSHIFLPIFQAPLTLFPNGSDNMEIIN